MQQVPPAKLAASSVFAPSLLSPTTTTACAIDGRHALLLRLSRCLSEMSFPTFPTHPIVSPGRKKDAAVSLAAPPQLGERGEGRAAVAVDGDRGSQYALKWAADHILSRARSFDLLHVRRKHTSLHGHGNSPLSLFWLFIR
jgi:hypothetical protein